MSKTSKLIPLISVIAGWICIGVDAVVNGKINENIFTAMIYATLAGSAAVGVSKYVGGKKN